MAKQTGAASLKAPSAGKHIADDRSQAAAIGGSDLLQDVLDEIGAQDP